MRLLPFQNQLVIGILSMMLLSGCGSNSQLEADLERAGSDLDRWAQRLGARINDWGNTVAAHIDAEAELWRLRSRIDQARDQNLLSPDQVSSLKNSVQFIEKEKAKLNQLDGAKLLAHRAKLTRDLNRVSDRLERWNAVAKLDFERKLQDLRHNVTVAKSNGNLSNTQESSLENSLRWIDNLQRRSRADGTISQQERAEILAAIDRVDRRLDGWVASKSGKNWF